MPAPEGWMAASCLPADGLDRPWREDASRRFSQAQSGAVRLCGQRKKKGAKGGEKSVLFPTNVCFADKARMERERRRGEGSGGASTGEMMVSRMSKERGADENVNEGNPKGEQAREDSRPSLVFAIKNNEKRKKKTRARGLALRFLSFFLYFFSLLFSSSVNHQNPFCSGERARSTGRKRTCPHASSLSKPNWTIPHHPLVALVLKAIVSTVVVHSLPHVEK